MSPVVAAKAIAAKVVKSDDLRSASTVARTVARTPVLLRDRFRGALLGLTLVPTAAALHRDPSIWQHAAQMTDEVAEYFQQYCQQWAPLHTSRTFLPQPIFLPQSRLHSDSAQSSAQAGAWLACVPMLLRYYDQPPSIRHQYIQNAIATNATVTAQQWVLGDVLSRALRGEDLTRQGWEVGVEHIATEDSAAKDFIERRKEMAKKDRHLAMCNYHYRGLWNAILEDAPIFPSALTPTERLYHQEIIAGVSKAIEYGSQMCALASNSSTGSALNGSALTGSTPNAIALTYALGLSQAFQPTIAPDSLTAWRSPLIVGLVLGAVQGRSGLPVLWQQSSHPLSRNLPRRRNLPKDGDQTKNCPENRTPNPAEVIALADTLFAQWSGCAT